MSVPYQNEKVEWTTPLSAGYTIYHCLLLCTLICHLSGNTGSFGYLNKRLMLLWKHFGPNSSKSAAGQSQSLKATVWELVVIFYLIFSFCTCSLICFPPFSVILMWFFFVMHFYDKAKVCLNICSFHTYWFPPIFYITYHEYHLTNPGFIPLFKSQTDILIIHFFIFVEFLLCFLVIASTNLV